jgi:hypothetical protein
VENYQSMLVRVCCLAFSCASTRFVGRRSQKTLSCADLPKHSLSDPDKWRFNESLCGLPPARLDFARLLLVHLNPELMQTGWDLRRLQSTPFVPHNRYATVLVYVMSSLEFASPLAITHESLTR